jgi:uncharacterized OB-fold protein
VSATAPTESPPQPGPDIDSEPYWAQLARGALALQRCAACAQWQFPPLEVCRHCAGALAFARVTGAGAIHTFIVEHHKVAPGFDAERPYAIALVALDEAPHARVPGRIVGAKPGDVRVGARVQAEIEALAGGARKVAVFRLTGARL